MDNSRVVIQNELLIAGIDPDPIYSCATLRASEFACALMRDHAETGDTNISRGSWEI